MEQAFGCKVFNQYGSREIPNIACECRLGNMHVFTDMVYAEMLVSLEAGIQQDVDAQMRLDMHYLEDFPRTVSGKHRFVIGMA
jgi:hypothetical protein